MSDDVWVLPKDGDGRYGPTGEVEIYAAGQWRTAKGWQDYWDEKAGVPSEPSPWTRERPTTPGWYWLLFHKTQTEAVRVEQRDSGIWMQDANGDTFFRDDDWLPDWLWSGPILPPALPTEAPPT